MLGQWSVERCSKHISSDIICCRIAKLEYFWDGSCRVLKVGHRVGPMFFVFSLEGGYNPLHCYHRVRTTMHHLRKMGKKTSSGKKQLLPREHSLAVDSSDEAVDGETGRQ